MLWPDVYTPEAVLGQRYLRQCHGGRGPQSQTDVLNVLFRNFASKQWKVDSSAYIMFLATKLTYYGLWLSKQKDKKQAKFMNYLGYCLFFPSISGPTFSY